VKAVIWTDTNGRKRRSLIKDGDAPELAKYGIPADPPDIRSLDIEAIFQEIENLQYQQGLFTWRAALDNQGGMQALLSVFKRHLLELYRNK
jgi:hypothetical protein